MRRFFFTYNKYFAQVTQRAGNFLVSRTNDTDFSWDDVKGKTIIGGRAGGMPQMILEYVLKQKGIGNGTDVEILTNLQFTTTAGAFVGGVGDYTAEFDPSAYNLEKEGAGYVVASLGLESGKVPYTVYMATQSFIKEKPEVIQKFTNAIYKAQQWVDTHSAEEIAKVITPHFTESSLEDIAFIVDRYKAQGTWKDNPIFDEEGFTLIQDIMEAGGELSQRIPYQALINTDFAEKAMKY